MTTNCRAQPAQPRPSPSTHKLLAALATLLFTLTAMPAQAANNYTFPGNLPGGCNNNGNGNYSCGALTLGPNDTITIAAPRPATITMSGALALGDGAQINAAGSASDLNLIANGFNLGPNLVLNGSVTSILGAGLIGAGSKITGNITTDAGILTVGDNVTVTGNVNTAAGAVNMGINNKVSGNVNTLAGIITIGADSSVGGYVRTTTGGVNLGARNAVAGNITTLAGVVTIGAGSTVGGNINTAAGGVNLGASNIIGGSITTLAGVVTIGANSQVTTYISTAAGAVNLDPNVTVGGNISTLAGVVTIVSDAIVGGNVNTTAGAVNIGNASRICGSINTLLGGVITLTTNVKVGGGISTLGAGAITISGGSTVGGNIKALVGVITLTGVDVGGDISAAIGAITLTTTRVHGSVTSLIGALTKTNSTSRDQNLVITAACSAAPIIPTTSGAASFDALETGTNLPWSATARKPLYTKLTGAPFTLDIAALKLDGTLESAYVLSGAASKFVKLELFDDVGTACSAYANPVAVQTANFVSSLSASAPGRVLSGAFTVTDAHRSLLVRIKECTSSACIAFTSTTPACSSDRFSVRPSALTLSTTTPMGVAPQPTATNIIRAGADFTLLAKTSPTGNYDGTLTLDASRLTAQLPSEGSSAQSGGVIGVLTPSTLTANANAVMASYSEVGYLYIGIGAYRDDIYTAVDSTVGDCITSTASNANLADTLSGGKYGCSIGNMAISSLGRFVPNHFSTVIAPGAVMPCPAALLASGRGCPLVGTVPSFIYSGQPFSITITALSLNGTPTVNYKDLLARDVTLEAWSAPGMLVAVNQNPLTMKIPPAVAGHGALSSIAAGTFALGVAGGNPTYSFPAGSLAAPTDIYLRARENSGVAADDVSSARAVAAASVEAGVTVVSGRIKVDNNYGSELLAVPVRTSVQYWDGLRFINSTTDVVSTYTSSNVKLSDCKKTLMDASKANIATDTRNRKMNCNSGAIALDVPATPATTFSLKSGATPFRLKAPGHGNGGSVDVSIDAAAWLPSTRARIGVGVYKAGPVIYMRERY